MAHYVIRSDIPTDGRGGTGDSGMGERDIDLDRSTLDGHSLDHRGTFLTERQALVLALRERGRDQGDIAEQLECSRANVSNIERSARENIEKAKETIAFAEVLSAPVHVTLPQNMEMHDVPDRIYSACDEAGIKVNQGAPELMRMVEEASVDPEERGLLSEQLVVRVTANGVVHIIRPDS